MTPGARSERRWLLRGKKGGGKPHVHPSEKRTPCVPAPALETQRLEWIGSACDVQPEPAWFGVVPEGRRATHSGNQPPVGFRRVAGTPGEVLRPPLTALRVRERCDSVLVAPQP